MKTPKFQTTVDARGGLLGRYRRTPGAVCRVPIMDSYGLTRGDVCRILGLKPRPNGGSHGTVDSWLAGTNSMPRAKLELVMLKAPTYRKPPSPRARALKTTQPET